MTDDQTTLALLSLAAVNMDDFDATLQHVLKIAAEAINAERTGFWTLHDDGASLFCELEYGSSRGVYERGASLRSSECPRYFQALHDARVIAANDAQRDPRTSELAERYLVPRGVRSMMDVPVWTRGTLTGALCHEHMGAPRTWTSAERAFAIAVGQIVARALEARRTASAETGERRALLFADVSAALSETLELENIPSRLASVLVPRFADALVVDVAEDGELRRIAAVHVDPRRERILAEASLLHPPTLGIPSTPSTVVAGGRSILISAKTEEGLVVGDERQQQLLRDLGIFALVAVPLVARGSVLGALWLGSTRRAFTSDDLLIAEELGRRAGIHIENARLHVRSREALGERDAFLTLASHELLTPLTALDLAVESLRRAARGYPDDATSALTVILRRQVRHLTRLVGDMLDVSSGKLPRLEPVVETVDLAELAGEVTHGFETELARAGCELRLHADHPAVGGWDRALLERALVALLANAIKFGPGKPIDVVVEAGARARLVVQDRGAGIPQGRLAYVFGRFERAASARHFGGLGLGLYITRCIVEAHGGLIQVDSPPGEGARFTLEIPYVVPS